MEMQDLQEEEDLKNLTKTRTVMNITNDEGVKVQEIEYLDGVPDGKGITYDPNTQKKIQEMNFQKGVIDGPMRVFDLNGDIAAELNYSNGEMSGKCRFFVDGKIVIEGQYKNGKYDGKINYYDSLQNIIKEEYYNEGIKIGKAITYANDGQIIKSENYLNGKLDGMSVSFYPGSDNQILESVEYINGELNGETKIFYEDGNLKEFRLYSLNKIVGEVKKYDRNGNLIK